MELGKLKWKNIITYGDNNNEIDFRDFKGKTVSFYSDKNGVGKSSIIDVLKYSIFGNTYRPTPKQSIINWINGINLYTEIDIYNNDNEYTIKRVQKSKKSTDKFNIFVNGQEYNNDSSTKKLTNEIIESRYLNMSPSEFDNTIVLSSSSDMVTEMKIQDKRKYFETLFNISFINEYKSIYSKKINALNTEITINKTNIKNCINSLEEYTTLLKVKNDNIEEIIKTKHEEYKKLNEKLLILKDIGIKLNKEVNEKKDIINNFEKELNSLRDEITKVNTKILINKNSIEFYTNIDVCKTCNTKIDEKTKKEVIKRCNDENNLFNNELLLLKEKQTEKTKEYVNISNEYKQISDELNKTKNEYQLTDNSMNRIKSEVKTVKSNNIDVNMYNDLIKQKEQLLIDLKTIETENSKRYDILFAINNKILNDTGFRQYVLSNYINILNSLIETLANRFTDLKQLKITITPDMNIEYNRLGTLLSYDLLSGGEKTMTNIVILLSMLKLRKMFVKESKILILDEIIDTGLIYNNVVNVFTILRELFNDYTIIVISHKLPTNMFDHVYKVDMDNMFSFITKEK